MSGPCHSLYGEAVLLALHSLPHSVVVARLDHLGYQLKEGVMEAVRSEDILGNNSETQGEGILRE